MSQPSYHRAFTLKKWRRKLVEQVGSSVHSAQDDAANNPTDASSPKPTDSCEDGSYVWDGDTHHAYIYTCEEK